MDWNRKDCNVKDTINNITKLLKNLDIETYVITENRYKESWYSYNIGIKGLPGIYTNGKGISPEYAMASALAEMMERLQNNILLGPMFLEEERENDYCEYDDLIDIYRENWKELFNTEYSSTWLNFLKENRSFCEMEEFENLSGTEKKNLPINFVAYINGSNGTCAGNTREEALTQGLAEVYERYVLKQIYYGMEELEFPDIPVDWLKNLRSYELIEKIEECGYKVKIKDLTLDGSLPVLGLIVFDTKYYKYKFSVASDLDIDICLQRCITETFQGRDIKNSFRRDMNKVLCDSAMSKTLWKKTRDIEYMRSLIAGEGKIPNKLLLSKKTTNNLLSPFLKNKCDNKECLKQMEFLASKMGWEVWIKDNSYLNFPSYRIYVKDVTDAFVIPQRDILREIMSVNKLKQQLKRTNSLGESNFKELYYLLKEVRDYPRYSMRKNGLINFCGIIFEDAMGMCDSWEEMQYLLGIKADIDIDELLGIQREQLELGESDKWKNVIKKYQLYKSKRDCSPLFLKMVCDLYGVDDIDCDNFKIEFPACGRCDKCLLNNSCIKEKVLKIKRQLQQRKELYRRS